MEPYLTYCSFLFQIAGTILLAREVYLAQEHERIAAGLKAPADMLFLYAKEDYAGLVAYSQLDMGTDPQQIHWLLSGQSQAQLQATVQQQLAPQVPAWQQSLERWEKYTTAAVYKWRRYYLILGAVLIVLGAILQLPL